MANNHQSLSRLVTYIEIRTILLVFFSGISGVLLAPGNIHFLKALYGILCVTLAFAAIGFIDKNYAQHIQNKIFPKNLIIAIIFTLGSIVAVGTINLTASFLLLLAALLYVFGYIICLKQTTPENIFMYGAIYGLSPVIGWSMVNGDISIESFLLFAIILFWIPIHFLSSGLWKENNYRCIDNLLLPKISDNPPSRMNIMICAMLLLGSSIFPVSIGMFGIVYTIGSAILGIKLLEYSNALYREYSKELAVKVFKQTEIYIVGWFVLVIVDVVIKY